jgi:hypothetical protein
LPITTDVEGLTSGRQSDAPFIAQVQREPQQSLRLVGFHESRIAAGHGPLAVCIAHAHPPAIQAPLTPTHLGGLKKLARFERPFLLERDQGALSVPARQHIAHHALEITTLLVTGQVDRPGNDQGGGQRCAVMLEMRLATKMLHRRLGVQKARATALLQGLHRLRDVRRQMQTQMMALRQPGIERSALNGAQHAPSKLSPIGLAPLGPQQHVDPRAVVMRLDRRCRRATLRRVTGGGDDQIHRAFAQAHEAILEGHRHKSQSHAEVVGQRLGQIHLQPPVTAFGIEHGKGREVGPDTYRDLAARADSFQRGAVGSDRGHGGPSPQRQQADACSEP